MTGQCFPTPLLFRTFGRFTGTTYPAALSVFLLTLMPAESLVAITGEPWVGIIAYGFLFYVAPLVGLTTYAADRSPGRRSSFTGAAQPRCSAR